MKKIIITLLLGIIGAFGLFVLLIRVMADKAKDMRPIEGYGPQEFQSGDIIFQTSKSGQRRVVCHRSVTNYVCSSR